MNTVEGLRKQNASRHEAAQTDTAVKYDGGLYIGGTGDLTVKDVNGDAVTYSNIVGWFPFQVYEIVSATTTATNIIGLIK